LSLRCSDGDIDSQPASTLYRVGEYLPWHRINVLFGQEHNIVEIAVRSDSTTWAKCEDVSFTETCGACYLGIAAVIEYRIQVDLN
jgi:hypothetical protein